MVETELKVEERAQIMGWVPEEEFKGDPQKWVAAEQWVERAEKLLPLTKAMVTKLTEDIASLRSTAGTKETALTQEIAGLKKTLGEFAEFSKKAEERAFKKAVAELEVKQRQAVAEGDTEAFDAVKTELDELKQHPALTGHLGEVTIDTAGDPVQKGWPEVSDPAVYQEWATENEWVSDVDMGIYARQVDLHLQNTMTFPTQLAQLEKITELVKKKFPDYWSKKDDNPNQRKPQTVEGGGEGGGAPSGGKGKKNYNDLPAAAKAYCDEWSGKDGKGTAGTIPGFTRQDYVDQYQWD